MRRAHPDGIGRGTTMIIRGRTIDFSARGWPRVWLITALGTFGCVLATMALNALSLGDVPTEARGRAILFSALTPALIAAPLFFAFSARLRQMALAHHRLSIIASTDSLTKVLNRGAFRLLVEEYLRDVADDETAGAMLIVDVDHFKAVNDTFGNDRGDDALRIISSAIRGSLRNSDLVGRLGGEEFGVFLPSCPAQRAEVVAERIRVGVAQAAFAPVGSMVPLSVSVGGASFMGKADFDALYHLADQRLYAAKQLGRNRVAMSPMAFEMSARHVPSGAAIH